MACRHLELCPQSVKISFNLIYFHSTQLQPDIRNVLKLSMSVACVAYHLFKEQSLDPSVLLAQTKPEGVSPRVSEPTKHKGPVIVPIITHLDLACFV